MGSVGFGTLDLGFWGHFRVWVLGFSLSDSGFGGYTVGLRFRT